MVDRFTDNFEYSHNNAANRYFYNCMKKVFIARPNYLTGDDNELSFSRYEKAKYCTNSFYFSVYALMGLNKEDSVVSGYITLNDAESPVKHCWTEFSYDEKEYVYDYLLGKIVDKHSYYEHRRPNILYKATLDEILEKYVVGGNCLFCEDDQYSLGAFMMQYELSDMNEEALMANAMSYATIEVDPEKKLVKKFVARENDTL